MHFHTKLFEVRSWCFGAAGWPINRDWGELCAQYPQGDNGDRSSELEKLIERGPSRLSVAVVRLMFTNAIGFLDVSHAKL